MANFIIITNNPLVLSKYGSEYPVDFKDISYEELLLKVRDAVHNGAKLLTHPLSGSIKPNETPYKSVYVTKKTGGAVDFNSLEMIENAIITAKKFPVKYPVMPERMRADFALIDQSLVESALVVANQA